MSGGVAFVHTRNIDKFEKLCNKDTINFECIDTWANHRTFGENKLFQMLQKHYSVTKSPIANTILSSWELERQNFIRIMPKEFERALLEQEKESGRKVVSIENLSPEEVEIFDNLSRLY